MAARAWVCKAVSLCVLVLGLSAAPAGASDDAPAGVQDMLYAAQPRGEVIWRTVLETALMAYPDQEVAIYRVAQEVAPEWMRERELSTIQAADYAVVAEKARQRARGIWYYLDPSLWNARADLGGGQVTGDTEETAVNLTLHFDRAFEEGWSHRLDLSADFARRQGATSRERFVGDYGLRYELSSDLFLFDTARGEIDRFSGFDYRVSNVAGAGLSLFTKNPKHSLTLEVGGGVRINKLAAPIPGEPVTLTEFLTRAEARYTWQLSEDLQLTNRSTAFLGSNSITLEDEFGLTAALNSHLAARFTFIVNYESDAPEGSAPVDTVTRASLSYSF